MLILFFIFLGYIAVWEAMETPQKAARAAAILCLVGAVNIPLGQLRSRLGELPRDRDIHVICRSGGRAYFATRILLQNGFKARTLSGGMLARTHAEHFWTS